MNYVNLIGRMTSKPKFFELEDGIKMVNFTMATQEPYLDAKGKPKVKKYWHKMTGWGHVRTKVDMLATPGSKLMVEGRLITRFYQDAAGKKKAVSEVEINDIEIL